MASKTTCLLPFILLSLTPHFTSVTSQTTTFQAYRCVSNTNNPASSTFMSDLNTLVPTLSANIGDTGFWSAFLRGAYAEALCRPDIPLSQCRSCVNILEQEILQLPDCPLPQPRAFVCRKDCIVRYDNEPIFGKLATWGYGFFWNADPIASPDELNRSRGTLFDELRVAAANGGFRQKAAAGNRSAGSQTVYAMAQCTPDLSMQDCSDCLVVAATNISQCCDDRSGAGVYLPSCTLRYDIQLFYDRTRVQEPTQELSIPPSPSSPSSNSSSPPSSVPPPPGNSDGNKSRNIIIIVISIAVIIIVALCVGVGIFARKRMKQKAKSGDPKSIKQKEKAGSMKQETEEESESMKQKTKAKFAIGKDGNEKRSFEVIPYDLATIRDATKNFSDANKLGQGGFGVVYEGTLQNGEKIAVKRLSSNSSGQGDPEFKTEALFLAKLQHRNLVRLLGFSNEGDERVLVYEFVEKGSLDHFIFDPIKSSNLNSETRCKIIGGIANGLSYLHHDSSLPIIHRDLKASNVLLDEELNPKISDFGLAKLAVQADAHTSKVIGTNGYMAPEYVAGGQFSFMSDIFSFGVLVLEVVTGRKVDFQDERNPGNLISHAWRSWRETKGVNMIDPSLMVNSGAQQDILRCFHIALLCVQRNPEDRPKMDKVVQMLNGSPPTLPSPSEPGFYIPSSFYQAQVLENP